MSVLAEPIEKSVKHTMPNQKYVTITETCEFTYEWTIEKFSQYKIGTIESSTFSSNFSDFNDVWILKMDPHKVYPRIFDDNYDPYDEDIIFVSVQLKLLSFNDTSPLFTKCKISIHPNVVENKEYAFDKFPKECDWMYCISRDSLSKLSNEYLQNDELKISCTITISKEQKNNSAVISAFDPTPQLNVDLKKLLLNELSADITIKVGQKSFRVIKGILAVRSPVFFAMFDHEQFKENKESEIVIEDIEEDVFEEFLHYIYTDETKNVKKMPIELFEVADKYQVDRLKNICEEIICTTINSDNVTSTLIFSDKYNIEKLHKKCLEFIKTNLRAVLSNESFQAYKETHSKVFISVLESIAGVH